LKPGKNVGGLAGMERFFFKFFILSGMLVGLPMLGIVLAGHPVDRYLEFPPETQYVTHAPFSWAAFAGYSLFVIGVVLPLFIRGIKAGGKKNVHESSNPRAMPWWGWLGIIFGCIAWILAWTRFSWFSILQPHTFTPLWLSFILVINALNFRHTGRCMMINRPGFFLLLFPTSAVFWWFFEYLNRFVQNWHYTGVHYQAWEYFVYATLSFSTVLPAVLGTREWILGSRWLGRSFSSFFSVECPHPRRLAWIVLVISAAGLTGIGVWPDFLFPLLWISPLLIIVSLQTLMGEPHVFSDLVKGNWRLVISAALAALFCGWFWEMWNYFSLAKWEYSVSFVHRFQIFEMPVLGYAGYLPFGLECVVIGNFLEGLDK